MYLILLNVPQRVIQWASDTSADLTVEFSAQFSPSTTYTWKHLLLNLETSSTNIPNTYCARNSFAQFSGRIPPDNYHTTYGQRRPIDTTTWIVYISHFENVWVQYTITHICIQTHHLLLNNLALHHHNLSTRSVSGGTSFSATAFPLLFPSRISLVPRLFVVPNRLCLAVFLVVCVGLLCGCARLHLYVAATIHICIYTFYNNNVSHHTSCVFLQLYFIILRRPYLLGSLSASVVDYTSRRTYCEVPVPSILRQKVQFISLPSNQVRFYCEPPPNHPPVYVGWRQSNWTRRETSELLVFVRFHKTQTRRPTTYHRLQQTLRFSVSNSRDCLTDQSISWTKR